MIDLGKILAFECECWGLCHTQAPSEIDCIWGAYGDGGRALFPFADPSPDIPDKVLFLLLELDVETLGRDRSCGLGCPWRLESEVEVFRLAGGGVCGAKVELSAEEDLDVGCVISMAFVSADFLSVRKLAFDILRRSFRKEGAISLHE